MCRSGIRLVPEGSGEQSKMEETGCEVICGAPNDPRGYGIGEGGGVWHVLFGILLDVRYHLAGW